MLDPIVNFFTRVFQWIGRGIGFVDRHGSLWPFLWAGRWYAQRGWILKAVARRRCCSCWSALYGYFIWNTQGWTNFNPDYVDAYNFAGTRNAGAGRPEPTVGASSAPAPTATASAPARRSAIADVTADLIDFNVNQNAWISSMILYKLGLFGMSWDNTPFFDNKASFQRGINQAVRRTTIELVDTLGRVRGTSQIDPEPAGRARQSCSSTKTPGISA